MHNVCWSTTTKSSVFHVTAFRWPCLFVCEYRLSCYSVLFYKRLYIQYKRLRVVGFAIYIVILYMFRKIAQSDYFTAQCMVRFVLNPAFPFQFAKNTSLDVLACSLLELIQAKVLFLLTFRKQTVLAAYLYLLCCVTLVSNYLCIYSNLIHLFIFMFMNVHL